MTAAHICLDGSALRYLAGRWGGKGYWAIADSEEGNVASRSHEVLIVFDRRSGALPIKERVQFCDA